MYYFLPLSLSPPLSLTRAVIVSCTGNAPSSLVDLRNSGADLVWGKPMPNFTNNEMQKELAPQLVASLAHAQLRAKAA